MPKKKNDDTAPGAAPGGTPAAAPAAPPAAPASPAARHCISCGAKLHPLGDGKRGFCEACRSVIDEHGQGRPADFVERLEAMEEAVRRGDPRLNNLDAFVKKISGDLTGKPSGLETVDASNPDQVGKVSGVIAGIRSFLNGPMGAMFRRRPTPAPAALPAPQAPPAAKS